VCPTAVISIRREQMCSVSLWVAASQHGSYSRNGLQNERPNAGPFCHTLPAPAVLVVEFVGLRRTALQRKAILRREDTKLRLECGGIHHNIRLPTSCAPCTVITNFPRSSSRSGLLLERGGPGSVAASSHDLPRGPFWERSSAALVCKCLMCLVGAPGLEPGTR
jgi:hypothetical protein